MFNEYPVGMVFPINGLLTGDPTPDEQVQVLAIDERDVLPKMEDKEIILPSIVNTRTYEWKE